MTDSPNRSYVSPFAWDLRLEVLSQTLHGVYQIEAKQQQAYEADTVRHPDEYSALPEHTKDYDRALAIAERDRVVAIASASGNKQSG